MNETLIDPNTEQLFLSDDKVFYTLEGEGAYAGYPSVFMRLSMCNLTCIGFKSPDSPHGCDSFISWSVKNKMTFADIYDELFDKTGYANKLENGAILKLTGGEPLVQQKQLYRFISYMWGKLSSTGINIDFETNGTIMPYREWDEQFGASFTVSPKLASNGDPKERRYVPDVLQYHANIYSTFKFVVQNEQDINEIFENYITPFNIQKELVYLMPCCGSRQELIDASAFVAEECKKHGFKFSSRLQLLIWNKALRV